MNQYSAEARQLSTKQNHTGHGSSPPHYDASALRLDWNSSSRWMAEDLQEARELQNVLLSHKLGGLERMEIATGIRPTPRVRCDIFDLF